MKIISHLFSISLLVVVLFSASATSASGVSSGYVYFGTPQSNHGACVGRGVCEEATDGINVTFKYTDNNPNVLMMIFSLSELIQKQPDQAAYFTDGSGSYMFDIDYALTSDMFAPLGLPSGSWILSTGNSTIVISGDMVIDYITFSTPATNY